MTNPAPFLPVVLSEGEGALLEGTVMPAHAPGTDHWKLGYMTLCLPQTPLVWDPWAFLSLDRKWRPLARCGEPGHAHLS